MLVVVRDWLAAVFPLLNLILMLTAVVKILHKVERDCEEDRRRGADHEERIRALEASAKQLIGICTKVDELKEEMVRVRDRLDAFLDRAAASTGRIRT